MCFTCWGVKRRLSRGGQISHWPPLVIRMWAVLSQLLRGMAHPIRSLPVAWLSAPAALSGIVYPQDHLVGTGADFVGPTLAAGFYRRRAHARAGWICRHRGHRVDRCRCCVGDASHRVPSGARIGLCGSLPTRGRASGAVGADRSRGRTSVLASCTPPVFCWRIAGPQRCCDAHEFAGCFGHPRSWLHLLGRVVGGIELVASRGRVKDRQRVSGTSEVRGEVRVTLDCQQTSAVSTTRFNRWLARTPGCLKMGCLKMGRLVSVPAWQCAPPARSVFAARSFRQ